MAGLPSSASLLFVPPQPLQSQPPPQQQQQAPGITSPRDGLPPRWPDVALPLVVARRAIRAVLDEAHPVHCSAHECTVIFDYEDLIERVDH